MTRLLLVLAAIALAGCGGVVFHPADRVDGDGDGFFDTQADLSGLSVDELEAAGLDCDDGDDNVFPGATELCDGKDNDCNGEQSEVETDADGDGYTECGWSPSQQLVTTDSDCNDDPSEWGQYQAPGNPEVCGMPPVEGLEPPGSFDGSREEFGLDDNCDGERLPGEVDLDQDGHAAGCDLVDLDDPDAEALGADCDDNNAEVSPSQTISACIEGVEYGTDCQPADLTQRITWYPDTDRDGDGFEPGAIELCLSSLPDNYDGSNWLRDFDPVNAPVPHSDCNDNDQNLYGLDLDGDGQSPCDGDALDDPTNPCAPLVFDGNPEVCDACDNDQDGQIDEPFDLDGDNSFSDPDPADPDDPSLDGCVLSSAYTEAEVDCDDTDPGQYGLDLDSDGTSPCAGDCNDNDPTISQTDADLDGYFTCSEPIDCDDSDPTLVPVDIDGDGVTSCDGDCNDTPDTVGPTVFPGSQQQCDGIADSNCDGVDDPLDIDNDSDGANECEGDCDDLDSQQNLLDEDGDGFTTCGGDCNDSAIDPLAPGVFPGASLQCDGVGDNDCNSVTDVNEADVDGDGSSLCDGDCNDYDASRDATDADGDGSTSCAGDCDDSDPAVTATSDADNDGWTYCGSSGVPADCDDGDSSANHSDADGDGNSTCDSVPDCDDLDPRLHELDLDGDGQTACDGDCQDTDAAFNGSAPEPRDGLDNDCDGTADEALIVAGELVVSELLISPDDSVADPIAEYVELTNVSAAGIDLRGWQAVVTNSATGGSATWTFPVSTDPADAVFVGAGERIVLARAGNTAAYGFDIADALWGLPALGDDGGSLTFRFGAVDVDVVSWTGSGCSANCSPGSTNPTYDTDSTWRPGHAMALSEASLTGPDADGDNDQPANWCEQLDPLAGDIYGSPGVAGASVGACEAN